MQYPVPTIKRFCEYKRLLKKYLYLQNAHIFSHDLARSLNYSAEQVRRDLMMLNVQGNNRIGYKVEEILEQISHVIEHPGTNNGCIIGFDKLGKAILENLQKEESHIQIKAIFDTNLQEDQCEEYGIQCYNLKDLTTIIVREKINFAVLTDDTLDAQNLSDIIVPAGIKGILSYTNQIIQVPDYVYIRYYNFSIDAEIVSYFTTHDSRFS